MTRVLVALNLLLQRTWLQAVVSLFATWGAFALAHTETGRQLEFEIEQRAQVALRPAKLSDKIAYVEVSREDNQRLTGKDLNNIPRHFHAELVAGLKRAGAREVIFDLLFSPSGSRTEDAPFVKAVLAAAPLKIAFVQDPDNVEDRTKRNGYSYEFEPPDFLPDTLPSHVYLGQAEPVRTGVLTGDIALICHDDSTGLEVPSVSLFGFCGYEGIDPKSIQIDWRNRRLRVGSNLFPMDKEGGMIVAWPPPGRSYEPIAYSDALRALRQPNLAEKFRDKVVFVGSEDDLSVPTVLGPQIGTIVLASALNTMLQANHGSATRVPASVNLLCSTFVAIAMSAAFLIRKRRRAMVAAVLVLLFAFALPVALLKFDVAVLDFLLVMLAAALAAGLAGAALAAAPFIYGRTSRGSVVGTVLFADVRGSTELVQRLGSSAGGVALNRCLKLARGCLEAAGGEIVRTQGDAVVALFRGKESHAKAAVLAALRLETLDVNPAAGFTIGIESGPVHWERSEHQGLPFHLAARLQAYCKEADVNVLVGPGARANCDGSTLRRVATGVVLRGIESPVDLWTPTGSGGTQTA